MNFFKNLTSCRAKNVTFVGNRGNRFKFSGEGMWWKFANRLLDYNSVLIVGEKVKRIIKIVVNNPVEEH